MSFNFCYRAFEFLKFLSKIIVETILVLISFFDYVYEKKGEHMILFGYFALVYGIITIIFKLIFFIIKQVNPKKTTILKVKGILSNLNIVLIYLNEKMQKDQIGENDTIK